MKNEDIKNIRFLLNTTPMPVYIMDSLNTAIKALEQQPKRGKWIWYEVNGVDYCKCDKCHNGAWEMEFDFCSYCGADMRESEDKG